MKSIGLASLPGEDLSQYECIILNGIKFLSEAAYSSIDNYVASGGSVLIFMPADCDQKSYDSRILRRHFGSSLIGESEVSTGGGFLTLDRLDTSHPIFSRYSEVAPEDKAYSIYLGNNSCGSSLSDKNTLDVRFWPVRTHGP